jgi:hypothetical protein
MTAEEERYVHFIESIECLNHARKILLEAVNAKSGILTVAAHGMALIEYAKPYKQSFGEHKRHVLGEPELSEEDRKLHKAILALRDQVLAHSDLTVKEAVVHKEKIMNSEMITVISNVAGPLPDANAVIGLIERTLDGMYREMSELEKAIGVEPQQGVQGPTSPPSAETRP